MLRTLGNAPVTRILLHVSWKGKAGSLWRKRSRLKLRSPARRVYLTSTMLGANGGAERIEATSCCHTPGGRARCCGGAVRGGVMLGGTIGVVGGLFAGCGSNGGSVGVGALGMETSGSSQSLERSWNRICAPSTGAGSAELLVFHLRVVGGRQRV